MSDLLAPRSAWSDWPRWDLHVLHAADGRAVLLAAAGGVAFDTGVRSGVATVGGALAVCVTGLALLASGRLTTATSRVSVGTAMLLGLFLALRTSAWLLPFDILGVVGLFALSGAMARDGRISDLPARLLAARAVVAVGHGLGAAGFLVAPIVGWVAQRPLVRAGAAARGIAITVPIVLVLGALLASADVVFASALELRLPLPSDPVAHVALITVGALGVGGVLRAASAAPARPLPPAPSRLGSLEWTILLGSVVALFTAFAITQVVTIAGGAQHVLETEDLTYAEYARTGYVQLLAVAAITGLVLAALRAVADRRTRSHRFTALAELTVALTGVVLAVALRRLGLYEDAYGWTMLRLMAKAGAVWLGVVFVLLGVRLAGVAPTREWFLPAALATGLAVLVTLNVLNPEAAVARHNLHHAQHELDPAYLANLSDDAVPTIVDALPMLPEHVRAAVCAVEPASRAPLGWNRATRAADDARERACP